MSEQDNSALGSEKEAARSGLLLSVEPLPGSEKYSAQEGDKTDTDTDLADTSDATDADGTDESEGDADGTDLTDGDGTDGATDGDGTDDRNITTDGIIGNGSEVGGSGVI
ncbi:MAG TPA: hypothetical protein VGX92_20545 [Pyrinomonadaceae bacterium]|jgi:hypothetical protein|nr:hypothetical protein [Pyrinomonadaceae bacterium]